MRFALRLLLGLLSSACLAEESGRRMRPEDLLNVRRIESVDLSRDGQQIAVAVARPRGTGEYNRVGLDSRQRSDVWIVPTTGGAARNLTHGERDFAGYWSPRWSPDGRHLAMLTTAGGDNVRLSIWDASGNSLNTIAAEGIDLGAQIGDPAAPEGLPKSNRGPSPFIWFDERHLLTLMLPAGQTPLEFHEVEQTGQIEAQAADAVLHSRGLTAHIWSSGLPSDQPRDPAGEGSLVKIDVITGAREVLGLIPIAETRLAHRIVTISNTRQWGTVSASQDPMPWEGSFPLTLARLYPSKIGVVSLIRPMPIRWISDARPSVLDRSNTCAVLSWSPDDDRFAFVGMNSQSDTVAQHVFVVDVRNATLTESTTALDEENRPLDVQQLGWNSRGALVAYARVQPVDPQIVSDDPTIRSGCHSKGTVAGNPLERWHPESGHWRKLAGRSTYANQPARLWLGRLPAEATHIQFDQSLKTAIYVTPNSRLYAVRAPLFRPVECLAPNRSLDLIAAPQYRSIDYFTLQGQRAGGLILLPYDYEPHHRYPLILNVYAGLTWVPGDSEHPDDRYSDSFLNPLVLAHHGFAILWPSSPLPPRGAAADPQLALLDGIGPAIDRAVELGIADPDRLGVIGHSYGGYTAAALLTRTSRFRAAVALSGLYDLVSMYGLIDRRYRYRDDTYAVIGPYGAESDQLRMGYPLQRDFDRYWRNSPIAFAEQINTPLLLIHGSIDVAPLSGAEELFASLARWGKRAEFVRYAGEEHSIESPGNVLDLWGRIWTWFDTYLSRP